MQKKLLMECKSDELLGTDCRRSSAFIILFIIITQLKPDDCKTDKCKLESHASVMGE